MSEGRTALLLYCCCASSPQGQRPPWLRASLARWFLHVKFMFMIHCSASKGPALHGLHCSTYIGPPNVAGCPWLAVGDYGCAGTPGSQYICRVWAQGAAGEHALHCNQCTPGFNGQELGAPCCASSGRPLMPCCPIGLCGARIKNILCCRLELRGHVHARIWAPFLPGPRRAGWVRKQPSSYLRPLKAVSRAMCCMSQPAAFLSKRRADRPGKVVAQSACSSALSDCTLAPHAVQGGSLVEYSDLSCTMGYCCSLRCYNAPHAWQMGWLPVTEVRQRWAPGQRAGQARRS